MRLLIVTATKIEAERLIEDLHLKEISTDFYTNKDYDTDLLITGIGIPATMFSMFANVDIRKYELIINCGIAGSFSKTIKLGTIFNVNSDYFGDIGFNKNSEFIPIFESKFNDKFRNLINNGKIYNTSDFNAFFGNLDKANGVTVNIPEIREFDNTDIETMEGAAFMLVCKHFKKNFIQIRGISNIIGLTKRENWDLITPINNYSSIIANFVNR
jgi:futalosine hydrolase